MAGVVDLLTAAAGGELPTEHGDRVISEHADHPAPHADLARPSALEGRGAPLQTISATLDALGAHADLGDALDDVIRRVLAAGDLSAVAILLLTSDGVLRARAQRGFDQADQHALTRLAELADSVIDRTAQARPLRLPRDGANEHAADEALLATIPAQSVVIAPLVANGEREGLLVLSSGTRELGDEWVDAARAIAMPIAQSVAFSRVASVDHVERRQAHDALHTAEVRLQQVVTATNAVIYAMRLDRDAVGAIQPVWVSDNISRVLGYSMHEALAVDWWSGHVHPDDRPRVLAGARPLTVAGQSSEEYRFQVKDGSYRWVLDERRISLDASGNASEVVGALVDITDRRGLETQLRQAQKLEGVGQLAGGIAHDFSNVLTAILGNADILLTDFADDDPRREGVDEIRLAAEHAATLTRQLLAYSRRHVMQPRVLNLNDVVSGMDRMLRRLLGEDLEYVCRLAIDLAPVEADSSQLEQVLLNLALNARDAMPAGGTLTIETRHAHGNDPLTRADDRVVLIVRDTGTGMNDATRARIFEPFFTTKEHGRGTGLGLATVQAIVSQCGGTIAVASELGVGTTFEVLLPPARRAANPTDRVRAGERTDRPRGTETLLLVEDEASVRRTTRLMLERQGYTVLEADGPTDALALCAKRDGPIDLLLTDVIMPAMSGPDLASLLVHARPGLRVLYTSGYPGETVAHLIEDEMQFLGKPFTTAALAEKVRDALDAPAPRR